MIVTCEAVLHRNLLLTAFLLYSALASDLDRLVCTVPVCQ